MSIRKFIFCDSCNSQALRSIEFRRAPRENERNGRRICDGRAWFEGDIAGAINEGWMITSDGRHICPVCQNNQPIK